jgi:D-serine dehydratase
LVALCNRQPTLWINPGWRPIKTVHRTAVRYREVIQTDRRLQEFAPLLMKLFPEVVCIGGVIESELVPVDRFRSAMRPRATPGRWLVKSDHSLPIAGSIKARGGLYEVLLHAESLALAAGILQPNGDRIVLASDEARALFSQHEVSVGSTGNLGLSIGVMAAALGFNAVIHMSADAKPWKKSRLRDRGVTVVEHAGDFGAAVAAGRAEAARRPRAYFVDDENSKPLFLGYSVAALRLHRQLESLNIRVDEAHPLFVYLPCGVGGAPGGITFGLRHTFGDHVHCFFAEPVASPALLVRLASAEDRPVSVREVGLDNRTEADGLAVAQASGFVAPLMRPLVSGVFTVPDEHLFEDLYRLEVTENIRVEPSAAAAFRGPAWVLDSEAGNKYLERHALIGEMREATHVLWTTGGAFVPDSEYRRFHERGSDLARNHDATGGLFPSADALHR